jgi:carboxymethylenebutenolidase
MRRITALAVASFLAYAANALAATVKTQDVTFPSGPETITGYLAVPDSPGKHPGMVVLHEDYGLTDWVKSQTRRLAENGYAAIAVDLYHGKIAYDPEYAYNLTMSVAPERAVRDMEAALHFLAAREDVNKEKIGSIGWSAGGKWSLLLAENDLFLAACVMNYAPLPGDPAQLQNIRAPVLAIFGADDRGTPPEDVETFESAMQSAHKSIEIKVYPGASHSFENPENQLGYREGAAEDAWQRTVTFLDQHLK